MTGSAVTLHYLAATGSKHRFQTPWQSILYPNCVKDRTMPDNAGHRNFIWLTMALVAMLLAGALTREIPNRFSLQILEYSSIVVMLVSLRSLRRDRGWLARWISIIGITLLVVIAKGATGHHYFEFAYLALVLIFFASAAWLVGSEVLLTGSVDVNKIVGSVALYILLALIWAIFYTMLLEVSPEAMKGVEAGPWYENMNLMTYFSFVTLTTLGYGDISPATPLAQVLVILEAVTGMFYLAIIVASLVGGMMRDRQ
jgi:voltage-gated potassium channel Kch